jgi:hypothetical protein
MGSPRRTSMNVAGAIPAVEMKRNECMSEDVISKDTMFVDLNYKLRCCVVAQSVAVAPAAGFAPLSTMLNAVPA